jgi:hypothetical protein
MEPNQNPAQNKSSATSYVAASSTAIVDQGSCSFRSEPRCPTPQSSHDDAVRLPTSFDSWGRVYSLTDGFGWQWEALRTFFLEKGYDLYVDHMCNGLRPRIEIPPAADSFGLLGDRNNFDSKPPLFSTVRRSTFMSIRTIVRFGFREARFGARVMRECQ